MTVVFHLHSVAVVVQCNGLTCLIINIRCGIVWHEGIEVTLAHIVLVSEVETELVEREAHTCSDTMGILPVDVVCGGCVIDTWRLQCLVAHAVLLIHRRHIVVTQTDSYILVGLELRTYLQGGHAPQRSLCMTLHHVVTGAVIIINIIIPVIATTVDDTHVTSAIVGILIASA